MPINYLVTQVQRNSLKMTSLKIIAAVFACSAALTGCETSPKSDGLAPLKTVPSVDVAQYLGQWYEIARYPNRFERGCEFVTANYSLIESGSDKGYIRVLNSCVIDNKKDKPKIARGVAKPLNGRNNAVLAVNFAPFPLPKGNGNYHILYLDSGYQFAVVGEPSRKYLWLLARTPKIDEANKAKMLTAASDNGYDLAKLEYVRQ